MLKQAAVVFAGVLVVTSAALWLTPSPKSQAAPAVSAPSRPARASEPPLRGSATPASHTDAAVRKSDDGHFWAEAQANGRHVRFLVDTGATNVALTGADAERLGLNVSKLDFEVPVQTAAGETRAAMVTLDYVSVAGARVDNVEALVVREGLGSSLLGMSYLGRLSRFEATQSALILRP
jgi:aspartyl protease family protein